MRFNELVFLAEDSDEDILAGMDTYEELNKPIYIVEIYHGGERYQDFSVAAEPVKKALFDLYEADAGLYQKVLTRYGQWIPPTKEQALKRLNEGLPIQFDVVNTISIYCIDFNKFVELAKDAIDELMGQANSNESKQFEQAALEIKKDK